MEIKNILKDNNIIGVASKYKSNFRFNGKVSALEVKNISKALKMVGLDDTYLEYDYDNLTISELWKIELLTKLDKDVIIVGNMYDSLIYKDREYMKKLFIKLSNDYHKKIVIIDNNVNSFINVANKVVVIKDKDIIFETSDLFDEKLYEYVMMPKIIEFIAYVNKDKIRVDKTLEIYELLKDIYRRVS
ncbi:MAG: hypothetical protein IJN13_02500 [Bacilli bacterium]|nr:hypothetical protein [Bacilli bacterium]